MEHGVVLPIKGWEDLFFDYLVALEKEGHVLPTDVLMEAVMTAQQLAIVLGVDESEEVEGYVH